MRGDRDMRRMKIMKLLVHPVETTVQVNVRKDGSWSKIRAIAQRNIEKRGITIHDLQEFLKKIREEER
jgi:YbbR domain-containing protein